MVSLMTMHLQIYLMTKKTDGFFDAVERAYDTSPRNDIKIVLGDFNVQVGEEPVNFPSVSNYSLHSLMNDNGSQLIQFAVSRSMTIRSIFHPYIDIRESTWRSPDSVTFSQIDHLLIDRRHKSNLMDVRSYRGSTIDSDHYLVIACLRPQISNVKQVTGIRTSKNHVSKLTSNEVVEQYRQQIEEKLNHITFTEQDNGEELWDRCKTNH